MNNNQLNAYVLYVQDLERKLQEAEAQRVRFENAALMALDKVAKELAAVKEAVKNNGNH